MSKARKKAAPQRSLRDTLDPAVMKHFPGVRCESYLNIFHMVMVTRWWQEGTEDTPLKPALARQVSAFVAGYMAAEESFAQPAEGVSGD